MENKSRPALFLDRDGTINIDISYLNDPKQLILMPGVGKALNILQNHFELVVVTNQSGIARGILTEERLVQIHRRLDEMLAEYGVKISKYYVCPHHPDFGEPPYRQNCECRKPKSQMYRRAIDELNIDVSSSWAIGDRMRDLIGPLALGCRGILISTNEAIRNQARKDCPEALLAKDWNDILNYILKTKN